MKDKHNRKFLEEIIKFGAFLRVHHLAQIYNYTLPDYSDNPPQHGKAIFTPENEISFKKFLKYIDNETQRFGTAIKLKYDKNKQNRYVLDFIPVYVPKERVREEDSADMFWKKETADFVEHANSRAKNYMQISRRA